MIDIESENLKAHVDLCAERYKQIEIRFDKIESKLNEICDEIRKNKGDLARVILTSALGISGSVIGLITTILMRF